MAAYTSEEIESARETLAGILARCERTREKFAPDTAQHTLQKNRVAALQVAIALLESERAQAAEIPEKEALEKARAPIASLLSKSEKAREKLPESSWQHAMLGRNIAALRIASTLLEKALTDAREEM